MQILKNQGKRPEELVKNIKNSMKKFVSPGVHTIEFDTNTWTTPKQFRRKWKIAEVFDLEGNKIIITSTPKGGPFDFPQI